MIEDKIICKKSDLISIADSIRSKLGVTDTYYVSDLGAAVDSIPTGTQLPALTNPGTSSDLLSGKELIDQNGNKVTGTIPTKTSSDLVASGANITVPAGYYAASTSKSVNIVSQATPAIVINSSGLITASATQAAGYVSSGTKSTTKQLATKDTAIIIPGTANQTIASGTYLTGAQTIKGDANLVADNIKLGISIFGVDGAYEGNGSGGNTEVEDSLVTRTITAYTNSRVTDIGAAAFQSCISLTSVSFPACMSIGFSAFGNCTSLTSVSFPACKNIGAYAFQSCSSLTSVSFPACISIQSTAFGNCSSLTSVSFPACKNIGAYAFQSCSSLTSVSFPACKNIWAYAFWNCFSLTSVSFPVCTSIESYAFRNCSSLTSVYLMGSSICQLANKNAFSSTSITSTKGSIIVPASLVNSYKTKTNWTYFSNRIFGA